MSPISILQTLKIHAFKNCACWLLWRFVIRYSPYILCYK